MQSPLCEHNFVHFLKVITQSCASENYQLCMNKTGKILFTDNVRVCVVFISGFKHFVFTEKRDWNRMNCILNLYNINEESR